MLSEALRPWGDLVEQLVGFADLRAGRVVPREAECGVADLVGLVAASLGRHLATAVRGAPELRVEPGLRLRADPDMLTLAMECLAANALLHGAGAVRLAATRCTDGARITAEDEGPGITPDRRDAVQRAFAVGGPRPHPGGRRAGPRAAADPPARGAALRPS